MFIHNIAVDVPLRHLFSYKHDVNLPVGSRVFVEFGWRKKPVVGFVWQANVASADLRVSPDALKPILVVAEEVLPADLISLINFVANYYHCPIGQAVFTAIPIPLRQAKVIDYVGAYKRYHRLHFASFHKSLASFCDSTESTLDKTLILNDKQQQIAENILSNANTYHPSLLYGITGSGKTEVYIYLVQQMLALNKQVLILVPEINLTPQLVARFNKHIGDQIVTLTSDSANTERVIVYTQVQQHATQVQQYKQDPQARTIEQIGVVIGTRLAIFTPFSSLGLIIVDEEHDQSFKQNEGLRYNARDLAIMRAHWLNIPIVLGSATPSLESFYNATSKKNYHFYTLTKRAICGATLPKITLIDIAMENGMKALSGTANSTSGHGGILCSRVVAAIKARLQKGELSLVFINRRGFAPFIACYQCGFVAKCNHCSSNMVYHQVGERLRCHLCADVKPVPKLCPNCHSQIVEAIGHGTQKLEEHLKVLFPQARILRIDHDTVSRKSAWQNIYEQVSRHEVDILVGTQMLAKGHDFAKLTLVVGVELDNALFSYDFRATEHLFAQLIQVAGRSGRRDDSGEVLLQTRQPKHELYRYLSKHDFIGFANFLLARRAKFNLPPYSYYAIIRVSARRITYSMALLHGVYDCLLALNKSMSLTTNMHVHIYQPVHAIPMRLSNKERAQIVIVAQNRQQLNSLLNSLMLNMENINNPHRLELLIDIDPNEI